MSDLSIYLLSVVGVVVLSIIIDLILPAGQINKYIKSIMSLFVILVIISPIPKLLNNNFSLTSYIGDFELNEEYISTIKEQQIKIMENSLEQNIANNGIENIEIEIWADYVNNKLKITNIFVETKNVVLSDKNQHIDIYRSITTLLIEQTGVREEQIVFNG